MRAQSLLGVYVQPGGVNVIFLGTADTTQTRPGDDIEACTWMRSDDLAALPDAAFLRPAKMRQILADLQAGRSLPLDALREIGPESWE